MATPTDYTPGTPSWVDLGTPDIEGSTAFSTALFGWEAGAAPQPEGRRQRDVLPTTPGRPILAHAMTHFAVLQLRTPI